jgi:hypothetical protein
MAALDDALRLHLQLQSPLAASLAATKLLGLAHYASHAVASTGRRTSHSRP